MSSEEATYALEPTTFRTIREAQEVTNILEQNLATLNLGAANTRAELVEIFSELVNNAAEHGISRQEDNAVAHVRFMPHRRNHAFDMVIVDEGPGIRATLARNPTLDVPEREAEAIGLAVQELVSGTCDSTRGIGLWMTAMEMRKPGRKLWLRSGTGLLTMYGDAETELREIEHRQGVMARLTVPC